MAIHTLQDLLKHHQDALNRHKAHHAKRPEQWRGLPRLIHTKQQADQYKIDLHQGAVDVLTKALAK